MNKQSEIIEEPKDICCICGAVREYGSMTDVNDVDFELLCENCKDFRCSNCNFLRSHPKFGADRYYCRYKGSIEKPEKKVCEYWKKTLDIH